MNNFQKYLIMLIKYLSVALVILDLCWKCNGASAAIDSSLQKTLVINSDKNLDAIESNNVIEYHKDHEITESEARKFLETITWEELNGNF
jgi:hypothetical protein